MRSRRWSRVWRSGGRRAWTRGRAAGWVVRSTPAWSSSAWRRAQAGSGWRTTRATAPSGSSRPRRRRGRDGRRRAARALPARGRHRARRVEHRPPRRAAAAGARRRAEGGRGRGLSPAGRERQRREWRLAAAFDHPSVLPVYDAGEADGSLFIAMRLVDGPDLATLIACEAPLAPARAARLVAQVAGALDVAHAAGLVHRDVKPANVLVQGRAGGEHAYLADFGVARARDGARPVTVRGDWLGTPRRRSSCAATRWTPARTSTPWAACSSRPSRRSHRSAASPTQPCCTPSCAGSRARATGFRASRPRSTAS